MLFLFLLVGAIGYGISYWVASTGSPIWRAFAGFSLAFVAAWIGGGYLTSVLFFPSGGAGHSVIELASKGMGFAILCAGLGTYKGRKKIRRLSQASPADLNRSARSASPTVSNDAYAEALSEIEEHRLNKGLWARSLADSGGDELKAKSLYIKARAESIGRNAVLVDTLQPIADATRSGTEARNIDPVKKPSTISDDLLKWMPAFIAITVIAGFVGYQNYEPRSSVVAADDRAPSLDAQGWTQESSNTVDVGPWLDYSPPGTRYYRDANRVIYRVYPPGVRPSAEPANPFGLNGSTATVPN